MHYWYGQASIVMTIISGNNIIIIESLNVRCCWSCKPCNSSCWTCRSGRHFENTISVFSVPLSWCSDAKSEIFLQLLNGEGEALQWNFIEPAHPCCVGEGQGNLFPPSRSSDATIWKRGGIFVFVEVWKEMAQTEIKNIHIRRGFEKWRTGVSILIPQFQVWGQTTPSTLCEFGPFS